MADDTNFDDLMYKLKHRDPEAAREVFRRYATRLILLARRHLDPRLLQKVDPEDVMQSAMKSFFRRQADGAFDLSSWDSLWSLLTAMTLHKCGHKVDYFTAKIRDVRREAAAPGGEDSSFRWEAIARDPTPAEAVVLKETVEELFSSLDPENAQIVQLALQGYNVAEISTIVGVTERTVYRRLSRVRSRLERQREENTKA
jgi:RNA polymerase sigma-70 factor (ECF subfamily)